jgi:hypothetical protein
VKKLILLAMVLGLFVVVGGAKADGAWVLWEGTSTNKDSSWKIVGAYPSYNSCIQSEEKRCQDFSVKECRICPGGHNAFDKFARCLIE